MNSIGYAIQACHLAQVRSLAGLAVKGEHGSVGPEGESHGIVALGTPDVDDTLVAFCHDLFQDGVKLKFIGGEQDRDPVTTGQRRLGITHASKRPMQDLETILGDHFLGSLLHSPFSVQLLLIISGTNGLDGGE